MITEWIQSNYGELKNICVKIAKSEDIDDLFHICIEQLLKNQNAPSLDNKQRLFFFARIVRNNFYSRTSPFYYEYKKMHFNELSEIEVVEKEYTDNQFDLDWVKKKLSQMDWYSKRIFEMYIEEGCSITKLSKRTTIPVNSCSRDINKIRKELRKLRKLETDIL